MKTTVRQCLDRHLIDKAKPGAKRVPASVWLESSDRHLASASSIVNSDPVGSLVMSWLAMHNIANAAAASIGFELAEETHGKVADFLACIFEDDLTDAEAGLIQTVRGGRNALIYDNPAKPNKQLIGAAYNLARKLRARADG